MKTAVVATLVAGLPFIAGWVAAHREGTAPSRADADVIISSSTQDKESGSKFPNPLLSAYGNTAAYETFHSEGQFRSEFGAIRRLGSRIASRYALKKLFARWATIDPIAALEATEVFDRYLGEWRITRNAVLEEWAAADAEAAFAAASDHTAVFEAWCRLDPEKALRDLTNNDNAKVAHTRRAERFGYAFSALAESDPHLAADRALEFDSLNDQRAALSGVFATWVRTDVEQALRWVATRADDGETYSPLIAAWIKADPAKASDQWLQKPPRYRPPGIESIIESWVQRDPYAAESWIDEKLTGLLRREADATFVRAVAPIDLQHALQRFESLSPGHRRQMLTVNRGMRARIRIGAPGHFLKTWSKADPSAALNWAKSLESPEERKLALEALETLN
jgi:hypothetical protein